MADKPVRTNLPNARVAPRFAGISTFCRFPRAEDVVEQHRPIDWVVYGVPYDGGVSFRPGARFGPRAIRDASQYMKPANLDLGLNLAEEFSMADGGDAPVAPFSCKTTSDLVVEFARRLGDSEHTKLFAVGGDHSIAYANILATWERFGRPKAGLALLHFDAHLDTVDTLWDEKYSHASPFIRAIEDRLINPQRMLSIGIRGPLNSLSDLEYSQSQGVNVVTYEDWRWRNGTSRIDRFRRDLGDEPVYLTFDIDCIDPAYAPGTGTPVCGGFTSAEAIQLIRSFAGVNLVGADVVEVLPERDPAGVTSLLASHLLIEVLSVAASRHDD